MTPFAGYRLTASLAVPLLVLACASPRARVAGGLEKAGVPPPVAACMAEHMSRHLSLSQLSRLGRLRRLDDDIAAGLSKARFLDDVRALGDAEILAVSSAAALVCWPLRAAPPL